MAFQASQPTRLLARATIALVAVMHFLPSAFGQEPSTTQGPEKPTQESELEELKARVQQLEQKVSELEKKEEQAAAPLLPGTTTKVPSIVVNAECLGRTPTESLDWTTRRSIPRCAVSSPFPTPTA